MIPNSFNNALIELARSQTALLSSEFLAPVTPGRAVIVRLAGTWCSMMIVPPSFEGWGVFRPLSTAVALCCREATNSERMEYLSLFPRGQVVDTGASSGFTTRRIKELDEREFDPGVHSVGVCFVAKGNRLDTDGLRNFNV
jgi:hypothetical protein